MGCIKTRPKVSSPQSSTNAHIQKHTRMLQSVLLVWLDNTVTDENNADYRKTVKELKRMVNNINMFTGGEECIQFIQTISDDKICMIISDSLGQDIVQRVHHMPQINSIFIFCHSRTYVDEWTKNWSKIKGIFAEIQSIREALKEVKARCENDAIPISFMSTVGDIKKKSLDEIDCSFMYTQIMKEIFLSTVFNNEHFKQYINFCREQFHDNTYELNNIKKFEQTYLDYTPIWWYTCECFLYPMLNRALRQMEVDVIIKMGFFISDLHRHVEQVHKTQFHIGHKTNSFIVYRGQGLSKKVFDELKNTKRGLMAFNNFLSTSRNREISLSFARGALSNPDCVGILFIMTVNPSLPSATFADITHLSYFRGEDEILFSMNTIFRIHNIQQMDGEGKGLFQVELILTDDTDEDLRQLTERIRQDTDGSTGWERLGELLIKLGHFDKGEEVYKTLLDQATKENDQAIFYQQLARIQRAKGHYNQAIEFYEKALEIDKRIYPPTLTHLAASYNNIGVVYFHMAEYPKALSFWEKAHNIWQKTLEPNDSRLANSYNNIGNMYFSMGENAQALSHYEKALDIKHKTLPNNHPNLASSYNNIGLVYYTMSEYQKALLSQEKALNIRRKALPPNHPDLTASYNNIGNVYKNLSEYSKALSYYEKDLEISRQSLPPDHPHLTTTYNDIGEVYNEMGDYAQALSYHNKALDIRQNSLPPYHPDLATSYYNIGSVYENISEGSKALSCLQKALDIRQKTLPSTHPHIDQSISSLQRVKKKFC